MQEYNQRIYNTVINAGYSDTLARLLVAQAQYETGNYKNNAFLKHNNAFGYKYVAGAKYQLPTAGNVSSEGNRYAAYSSLENSVLEVLAWLERRQKEGKLKIAELKDTTSYANALKMSDYYGISSNKYASGLDVYLNKLSIFYQANKKTVNYAIIGGVLVVLSLYVYYLKKKNVI